MLQTVMEGWDGMIKDVQQKIPTITARSLDHLKHPHSWGHVLTSPIVASHNSTHDVSHFEKVSSPPYQALRAFTRK
jgi:hypothetical protein